MPEAQSKVTDTFAGQIKRSSEARPENLHRLRAATSEGAVPKLIKDREQRSSSTESKALKTSSIENASGKINNWTSSDS